MVALKTAEKEGRVVWVEPVKPHTFEHVNQLLGSISFPLIADRDGREKHPSCNPAGIYTRLKKRNIPLEIITNDSN